MYTSIFTTIVQSTHDEGTKGPVMGAAHFADPTSTQSIEYQTTQVKIDSLEQRIQEKERELKLIKKELKASKQKEKQSRALLQGKIDSLEQEIQEKEREKLQLNDVMVKRVLKSCDDMDRMLKAKDKSKSLFKTRFIAIMDEIPTTNNTEFLIARAIGVIKSDPEAVYEGMSIYQKLREQEGAMCYKQSYKGLDKSKAACVAESMQKKGKINSLSFKILLKCLTGDWNFVCNTVEEIESNKDGTTLLFYNIHCHHATTTMYDIAVCFFKAKARLISAHVISGLITERYLGKDAQNRLYIQF